MNTHSVQCEPVERGLSMRPSLRKNTPDRVAISPAYSGVRGLTISCIVYCESSIGRFCWSRLCPSEITLCLADAAQRNLKNVQLPLQRSAYW